MAQSPEGLDGKCTKSLGKHTPRYPGLRVWSTLAGLGIGRLLNHGHIFGPCDGFYSICLGESHWRRRERERDMHTERELHP